LQSESFDSVSWSAVDATITANAEISPDGTQNAETMTISGSTSRVSQNVSLGPGTYTVSVYVKIISQTTAGTVRLVGIVDGSNTNVNFTPTTEWQRVTATYTAAVGITNLAIRGNASQFVGTVAIWGAQLELGAYATSYIPTTTTTVTRIADVASKTGISSLIGQTEGTLFIDFIKRPQTDTLAGYVCLKSNNSREAVVFWNNFSNVNTHFSIIANNAVIMNYNFGTLPNNENFKLAASYKSGETKVFKDGLLLTTLTNSFDFNGPLTNLELSSHFINRSVNESVNQVMVFPTALSDADAISLTTL